MEEKIMVCVTQQKSCESLIKKGYKLSEKLKGELKIIHVVKKGWKYLDEMKESDALEYLFDISKQYDAELSVYKAKDIEGKLAEYAQNNKITKIVMGESLETSKQQNMIKRLKNKIKRPVEFKIIKKS